MPRARAYQGDPAMSGPGPTRDRNLRVLEENPIRDTTIVRGGGSPSQFDGPQGHGRGSRVSFRRVSE